MKVGLATDPTASRRFQQHPHMIQVLGLSRRLPECSAAPLKWQLVLSDSGQQQRSCRWMAASLQRRPRDAAAMAKGCAVWGCAS